MVLKQLALGLVRKSGKRKLRVVSESKNNKKAIGNLKSFNKDRKLTCALHGFCDAYHLIYV
jgi:hypothetical protein